MNEKIVIAIESVKKETSEILFSPGRMDGCMALASRSGVEGGLLCSIALSKESEVKMYLVCCRNSNETTLLQSCAALRLWRKVSVGKYRDWRGLVCFASLHLVLQVVKVLLVEVG